jgi:hypothetical protein
VPVGKTRVQFHPFQSGASRRRFDLAEPGVSPNSTFVAGVRKPGVCRSVVRLQPNGLFEIAYRFLEILLIQLPQVISPLEVGILRGGIQAADADQTLRLRRSHLYLNLPRAMARATSASSVSTSERS